MFQLLRDADVYAPEPLGRVNVLIAAGAIVWIGEDELELDPALGVEVHDFAGQTVIPGIIDAHAHITGGGGEAGYATRVPPVPLSHFTSAGITTVVGVLGTDDVTRDTASLVATARGLQDDGLTAYCHTGGYHLPPTTLTGSVRGDIVHVDRILGVGEVAISDHRSSQPTLDELLRIASDTHVAGLMTGKAGIVHLHVGDGERGLELIRRALDFAEIPARVYNPTHVNRRRALFEEALELAARGCTVDITAFPVGPEEDAWSAEDAIRRYLDTDLPLDRVTVSSDGGGCLPVFDGEGRVSSMEVARPASLTESLTRLLASGLAPERVLPAFTGNAAKLLRLSGKGRVAPGADADLVGLDSDFGVRDVMVRGVWHVRSGELVRRGTLESSA